MAVSAHVPPDDGLLRLRLPLSSDWGNANHSTRFIADLDKVECYHGRNIVLHARSYLLPEYKESIPLYWEGGLEQVTYWLTKEDLLWLFEQAGMHVLAVQGEGDVVGLPCVGFIVGRS